MAGKKAKAAATSEGEAAAMQAISRALADPTRFKILERIAACDATTCIDTRENLCMRPATLSHHMKQLEEAGLIETVRDGKYVRAHLRRKAWKTYLSYLKRLGG